ncbi:cytoplasmic protein [Desulfosarcina sp.]|uniref:cytoplasmic protein n=1 Tax=Desulfosarcina sp. TaxID=2027861 RepID=UPI0039710AD0
MAGQEQIDFKVDATNLYREDAITDLKVASIRRMIPVTADGKDDPSRAPIFFGHTQILTPQGPLPLQARLTANNMAEAIEAFPGAMEQEMAQMVQQIRKMQAEEQKKQNGGSRIIVPGR